MNTKVQRGAVRTKDNEVDYFRFGTGDRQMVILPGMGVKSVMLTAEGVAGAYRIFTDDFTVYCFDRPKILSENNSIGKMTDDTAEAMRQLGIKNACVFGASQGGMMAQYLAIVHPDLVGRLLLGSSCARLHPEAEQVMQRWMELAKQGDIDAFCDYFISVLFGKDFADKFGKFIKIAHSDVTPEDFRRFILLANACDDFDLYENLDKIKCPVLVLGAKNDRVLTAEASVEIAEKLGCEYYLYGEEYGHCVFDEAPDFKQRMYEFFTR